MLEFHEVSKRYGASQVLKAVSFTAEPGEIIGIVGENGAGKSTLLNALCGLIDYDGDIRLDGRSLPRNDYAQSNRAGVWRVFQDPALIRGMRVHEAMCLGLDRLIRPSGVYVRRMPQRELAAEVLRRAGLDLDETMYVADCSFGRRQLIEAAKTAYLPPLLGLPQRCAAFDEPTAGISQVDVDRLLSIMRTLRDEGATVAFVSHRLEEVFKTVDRILVLRDGELVWLGRPDDISEKELQHKMVGRDHTGDFYHRERRAARPVVAEAKAPRLAASGICFDPRGNAGASAVHDVSLSVRPGEILGIGGLVDSGKAELARCLAGAARPSAGTLAVDGREVARMDKQWKRLSVAYIPPNRADEGLILTQSIRRNITLPSGERGPAGVGGPFGLWNVRRDDQVARQCVVDFQIKGAPAQAVNALSGGNQQKVLLAKWLRRNPAVLILDNPTIGIDIKTKEEVYGLLLDAAAQGCGIVFVSDEMAELRGMSDRIMIVTQGRVVREFDCSKAQPSEHELVEAMLPRLAPEQAAPVAAGD